MTNKKTNNVLVLLKAIAVLRCLKNNTPELSIPEIASKLKIPKSTVHRILISLEHEGLVEKNTATGIYSLGIGVLELATSFLNNMDVRIKAIPHMEKLSKDTGENVYLAIYDNGDTVNVHQEQGQNFLSGGSRIGLRIPAYLSALGKLFLANLNLCELDEYCSSVTFVQKTSNTIVSKELLLDELSQIKVKGIAIDNEEYEIGLKCIAAPIYSFKDSITAAISISAPANRMTDEILINYEQKIKDTAKHISEELGYFIDP